VNAGLFTITLAVNPGITRLSKALDWTLAGWPE